MPQIIAIPNALSINALIFLCSFLFFSATSNAQEEQDMQTIKLVEETIIEVQSGSSITVFVKARFARKKKGAARALTESHAKHQQEGYRYEDMVIYTENGDLEGFFVTYIKE